MIFITCFILLHVLSVFWVKIDFEVPVILWVFDCGEFNSCTPLYSAAPVCIALLWISLSSEVGLQGVCKHPSEGVDISIHI